MRIDDRILQEIKDKNNIVDVIRSYIGLTGGNGRYKAVCPFHNEKTPSFSVNETLQLFKCFGCGVGGDVIKFVQDYEKVEFMDAVEILAKRVGMNIEKTQLTPLQIQMEEKARLIRTINGEVNEFFKENLKNSKNAKIYLQERRLNEDTIRDFSVGYADMNNSLSKLFVEKYGKEILIESGLSIERDSVLMDKFRNRIIFPIIDRRGAVIGFGGRNLGEYGPKYLNSPENPAFHKKLNLYALNVAKNNIVNDSIILSEGYMDVISLHQNGLKNAVASLGTSITKEQIKLLKTYAKKIVIAYDSDIAGIQATKRAIELIQDEGLEVFVADLKDTKDPDEYAKKYGSKSLKLIIDSARTALKYNLYLLYKEYDLAIPNHRTEFIKKSQDLLKHYDKKNLSSKVEIEDAIITISEITKASIKSVGQGVYGKYFSFKQINENSKFTEKQKMTVPQIDPLSNIREKEKLILEFISVNREYIDDIEAEYFSLDDSKIIYENIRDDKTVFARTTTIKDENQFFSLVESVKRNAFEQKLKFLELQLDEVGDSDEAGAILMEIMSLNLRLKL
ncbi:MAG: DNA primase [Filifactoraceae bacterium]